jgi:predicted small secreted protein
MIPRAATCYLQLMKSSPKVLALLIATLAACLLVAPGCQTSKGFGKDVENLGEKIQDKSK